MSDCQSLDKFCIIGAGAAGLAASKYLKNSEIPFDIIESSQEVGGLWMYGKPGGPMYKNAHLISPKQVQAFSDFPMPEDYPDYPSHSLVLEYFQSYAKHFGLYEHIQFNTSVEKIGKVGSFWDVKLSNGKVCRYRGVIVASGYHNQPNYPEFSGSFSGKILHSKDYKVPEELSDSRVLVIGAGQSAIDIAVDSAVNAKKTFHSTRRGFVCLPKYIFGIPPETLAQEQELPFLNLPIQKAFKLSYLLSSIILKFHGFNNSKFDIPNVDFSKEVVIPNIDQQIYRYYLHGDITHKPNIQALRGEKVLFKDGSEENIDIIICATGYKVDFPFIDENTLDWTEESFPRLHLHIFHPEIDNIFFIGMIHPLGSHWQVFEFQSQLVASYIRAKDRNCKEVNEFDRCKKSAQTNLNISLNLYNSKSHYLAVDKVRYVKQLKQIIRTLS